MADLVAQITVSVIVLALFGAALVLAWTHQAPAGSEAVVQVLLGSLGTMASGVVAYWIGSSRGSARKTEIAAATAEAAVMVAAKTP